jgi:hypothetical protein
MNDLRTDQYIRIGRGCPISVDLQLADGIVEIILGESRLGDVRLQVDDPDTCTRLIASLDEARRQLATHRDATENSDPTTSRPDSQLTTPAVD